VTGVVRNEEIRRYGSAALWILAVAALYYGAAKLGLLQQLVRGQVTPLWPPTGVAVAGLLLLGLRIWPGIALGAFLVNVSIGPSLPAVLAITAGNTLAPVCACLLLRRAGFRNELDRLRDVLALVFLGALGAMLISSTVGSGVLVLAGALQSSDFWPTWSVWWTGDAMGVLVVAPLLLVIRTARWPRTAPLARWTEAAALSLGTLSVTYLATSTSSTSLLFLTFPFLTWAAFRFQLAGAASCALGVSTLAILAAAREVGPFAHDDLFENMVTLQAFNGAAALTALLLAAVIIERNRTDEEIRRVCAQLSEMVIHMEPRPATYQWPPPADDEGPDRGPQRP
jgi:integral membrane sensor domain MASE1